MRISTKGRYSLEALLYMALLPPGEYVSTRVVAEETGISEGYLEQLFIPLRKAGLLRGARGPQGGYVLARELGDISAGDILRAVEGTLEPVDCVSTETCPRRDDCMSRNTWEELSREINDCVDSVSLRDLVNTWQVMDRIEYLI